jgi:4-aminobutyrate aminotransferase-like enzyme
VQLASTNQFREGKRLILEAIQEASRSIQGVRAPLQDEELKKKYQDTLSAFSNVRGRELFYPFLASGIGHGPWVELADGSVKYDLITGIGINFFGHSHPALMSSMIDVLASDIMQGNLQPGREAELLMSALKAEASQGGSRLAHVWLTTCGTMANEIALKMVRQKRSPATSVIAFEDCFSGRSTAMQEITDNPKYREGQPIYGEVAYLPFFSEELSLEANLERTLHRLREYTDRHPKKYAALMLELVQGEGGFRTAPREFFVAVFEEAKKRGLAIWIDEIQTFGRTGELFAFQKFGLHEWVDLVTVGKMLQACAVFYTSEYNPKPGLVAGTFSGSSVALQTGLETLRLLKGGGYLGPTGKIQALSDRFVNNLKELSRGSAQGKIGRIRAVGGMIAFEPTPGTLEACKAVLMRLFERGAIAFYCGHGPYLIRMLPPLGVMTEAQVDEVTDMIGASL